MKTIFNEKQKKQILNLIDDKFKFLSDNLDFNYLLDAEFNNIDNFNESINDMINEQEIIYYSNAMDFLNEYDTSLRESLEIADDFGYTPKNLSSEILATLLLQSFLHAETSDLITEIENNILN